MKRSLIRLVALVAALSACAPPPPPPQDGSIDASALPDREPDTPIDSSAERPDGALR
ncbi:MAG: hypothetical protein U0269_06725 [Polyangiales bacterium]